MVVHANHPHEIAGDCAEALRTLVRSGIPTLNQAVLLRGVNDSVDTLAALCERLVDLGVMHTTCTCSTAWRAQLTSRFRNPQAALWSMNFESFCRVMPSRSSSAKWQASRARRRSGESLDRRHSFLD